MVSWSGTSGNDSYFAAASPFWNILGPVPILTFVWDSWQMRGLDGNDSLTGGILNDDIYGGNGKDTLTGLAGSDDIYGGNGDDLLYGGDDNDYLYGGKGKDNLYGGNGNDILNGYGSGAGEVDVLYGGDGADKFILGANSVYYLSEESLAFIGDFNHAQGDKIQLKGSKADYNLLKGTNYVGTSASETLIIKGAVNNGDIIGVIVDTSNFSFNSDAIFV